MKLPTDHQVRGMFAVLRRLNTPVTPKGPTGLDVQERRLLLLLHRARTGDLVVDGFPSATMGDGPRGNAELTSVEAAADRSFPGDDGWPRPVERDWIGEDAENAIGYLLQAVQSLGALGSRLDHADRVSSPLSRSEAGGAGTCNGCGGQVSGAAEDRLKRGLGPCCYSAWRRAGCPDLTEFKRGRTA